SRIVEKNLMQFFASCVRQGEPLLRWRCEGIVGLNWCGLPIFYSVLVLLAPRLVTKFGLLLGNFIIPKLLFVFLSPHLLNMEKRNCDRPLDRRLHQTRGANNRTP